MRKYKIEPKRVQFVYPKVGKSKYIVNEGIKDGNADLKILPPRLYMRTITNIQRSYVQFYMEE